MIAVSIIVLAVPEGLILAVTIALAFGLTRMKNDNKHVKRWVAVPPSVPTNRHLNPEYNASTEDIYTGNTDGCSTSPSRED